MQHKNRRITIRLTENDEMKLHSMCKKTGLTTSALVRKLIQQQKIKARPSKEIGQLYTEINRIGTNINQIAKAVNSGYATDHDIRNSEFLLQKVHDLMFKVANF